MSNGKREYRLAAIMFTNIEGFSSMLESHEASALDLLTRHKAVLATTIEKNQGRVIKTIGDATLADFDTATQAVKAGIDIQKALYEFNQSSQSAMKIKLRIGIHLGDAYFGDDDAVGECVTIANRLQAIGPPGSLCISKEVYGLVSNKIEAEFIDKGQVKLKDIKRELHVYEVYPSGIPGRFTRKASTDRQNNEGDTVDSNVNDNSGQTQKLPGKTLFDFFKDRTNGLDIMGMAGVIGIPGDKVNKVLSKLENHGIIAQKKDDKGVTRVRFGGMGHVRKKNLENDYKKHHLQKNEYYGQGTGKSIIDLFFNEKKNMDLYGIAEGLGIPPHKAQRILLKLESKGIIARLQGEDGRPEFKYVGLFENQRRVINIPAFVADYNNKSEKQSVGRIVGNIVSFLAVFPFLAYLNFNFTPDHLWFYIPSIFWFNGIADQINTFVSSRKKKRFFNKTPNLNDKKIRLIKKFSENFKKFFNNLFSYLSVNAVAILANMYLIPDFPYLGMVQKGWFFAMIIGWGAGVIGHFIGSVINHFRLKSRMKKEGIPFGRKLKSLPDIPYSAESYMMYEVQTPVDTGVKFDSPYGHLMVKALGIRDSIVQQVNTGHMENTEWDNEILPLVENFIKKIEKILNQCENIDGLLNEMPMTKINEEIAYCKTRIASDISETLKVEYEKAQVQWENHKDSIIKLKEQQELMLTRLNSSILVLQQYQINLAKMKALTLEADSGSLDRLKMTSDELTNYIKDLKDSYEELA
ncbi:MAG: 2TM domain-containing protein [Spirochaetales bacterium]|nr:2TM domain-containing protein [Spirochaetales bacterium]